MAVVVERHGTVVCCRRVYGTRRKINTQQGDPVNENLGQGELLRSQWLRCGVRGVAAEPRARYYTTSIGCSQLSQLLPLTFNPFALHPPRIGQQETPKQTHPHDT